MNASTTPSTSMRSAAWLLGAMWIAHFFNYCDRQAVFAMFPSLKADLRMSDKELGLAGAMFLWVYAFASPIAGQLADRYSKRLLVVLSLTVWSVVTVSTGFAMSGPVLLGLRAAMGISEALFMPPALALTAGAFAPSFRSRAISMLTTAQIVGTVGGSWFGGWMADRGQWRQAFFILGATGILYAVPYFWFLNRTRETTSNISEPIATAFPIAALLRIRTYLVLCVIFPVFMFGLWLIYGWFPSFLEGKFHLTQADAAVNATLYLQATTAVGLLCGGSIADVLYRRTRASRLWLMAASTLLCAPCLHALGGCETLMGTRIAAAAFGLFSGFFMANIFASSFEVVPANSRATAVGILNFMGAMTGGLATLFGGMWKQTLGIDRLMSLTGVAFVFAALLLWFSIQKLFPRDCERL